MKPIRLRHFSPFIGLILFLISLWILQRTLGESSYWQIFEFLATFPTQRIWVAVGLTVASYGILTCYDHLALKYLEQRLGLLRVSIASYINYCFSRNMGFALLTGGSIRYRFYSAWGLSAEQIARLISFAGGTFVLGVLTMGGSLLLSTSNILAYSPFPVWILNLLGFLALGLILSYLLWVKVTVKPLWIGRWEVPLPSLQQSLAQVALGSLDWTLKAGVLYYLVSEIVPISLVGFFEIYLVAQIVATISHVPGGLGVFEAAVVAMVPEVASSDMLAILLVYRGIYFLLPFGLAILLLGGLEALQHAETFPKIKIYFGSWVSSLAPPVYAAAVVISGAILFFSCATPTISGRLESLGGSVPLPLIELGHLGLSVIGAGFLLLARGILRRLRKAYFATILLLAVAAGLTLLKGLTYEQTILLVLILVALIPGRDLFCRPTSLLEESFPVGWLTIILIVSGAALWLASISYDLQTLNLSRIGDFNLYDDAARSLRAIVAAYTVLAVFLTCKLRHNFLGKSQPPGEQALETCRRIMARYPVASSRLISPGDKNVLLAEAQDAFLKYAATERFWVALDGPIGNISRDSELAWCFRKNCEHAGAIPVFYLVRESFLPVCLGMGMVFMQVGDEMTVPLASRGDRDKSSNPTDCGKGAYTFEMNMVSDLHLKARLQEIRAQWGEIGTLGEDGFSHDGFPGGRSKQSLPLAIVSCHQRPAAFARVLHGSDKNDFAIDLLHFSPEFGPGAAAYLLEELMVWGLRSGFANFTFGIVPTLQNAQREQQASWRLLGPSTFRNGRSFSSSRQMREFAEKLKLEASPRYVAFASEASPQEVLEEINALLRPAKFLPSSKDPVASLAAKYCNKA